MKQIVYAPRAQADLDEIWDYISETLMNPTSANNTVNGILDKVDMLKEQSEMGKPLCFSSGLYSGYRYLIYKNYLPFYRILDETVYVDRVVYGRRDYMQLLFHDLNDEE